MGSRVVHILAIAGVLAAALFATATASAATPDLQALFGACPAYSADGMHVCSAEVPSFDGAKLDVDLTLPMTGSGPHPLIVMLHGFGNDKHEWESTNDTADGGDKYHWNSHWFASKGYYVLTYTARGFCVKPGDCAASGSQPATPAGTSAELPNGTIHLKSREFEIRDTQWLAALVAHAFPNVDPHEVAVTGGSYGGGESWLQASMAHWTFPHQTDAALPVLDLRVAVPKYPWTDLAYSLAPNGHGGGPSGTDIYESSQGRPSDPDGAGNPVGVPKESYVAGFYALGTADGIFEEGTTLPTYSEGPINVSTWNARVIGQGDPYDVAGVEDPVIAQVRRGLTVYRSSYYQSAGWAAQAPPGAAKVAVFSIQGWTDDLFPAVESFRQFKLLKRLDPNWPVAVAVADVGHERAQNKPSTWQYLNNQANQWLASNIGGSTNTPQSTAVTSLESTCPNDPGGDTQISAITASTPEGLASGTLTVPYAASGTLANPLGAQDPNGPATDPVFAGDFGTTEPCRTSSGPATGGYTGTSQPLPSASRYAGLGYVSVPYTLTGANTATLQARVWDVAPDGTTLLVTRGTYRIDAPAYDQLSGTLKLPLFGNDWRFRTGHRIRLDLTQDDHPTFRPSTEASSIAFTNPRLVLPTRESGAQTVPGS